MAVKNESISDYDLSHCSEILPDVFYGLKEINLTTVCSRDTGKKFKENGIRVPAEN